MTTAGAASCQSPSDPIADIHDYSDNHPMPPLGHIVGLIAAKLLSLVGIIALIAGLALIAIGIPAGWLAWSGALLSITAFATLHVLDRGTRAALDRSTQEALTTIYMPLLNEGTDVWRPVEAMKITDLGYMVTQPEPAEEQWAFQPGHILTCEERQLDDGLRLVAVAKAT